jgi:O-antigen/teichoic acid export membrane protein
VEGRSVKRLCVTGQNVKMKNGEEITNDKIFEDASILKNLIISLRAKISRNRQFIKSVAALLSSNILSSVLTAVSGFLVARFMWPGEVGAFRAFTIPLTYLMFLNLGTNDGLWRQIPYYVGKKMPERVNALASSAGAFNLLLSAVVSFGFICCATYSLVRHDLYGVFGWLSQAIVCWGIFYGSYLTSTYRTLNHFVTLARIEIAQTILTFGMVFLLPFLRFYGLCARVAFPAMLGLWLFHRERPLRVKYRLDIKALREVIKIGLPFGIWGALYTTGWFATESALILALDGVVALGLFSVAYAVRSALDSLPVAIWKVITPRVVTSFAQEGSIRKANTRIIGVTAVLTGFMAIVAYAGSFLLDIFVPLLIPKYITGIPVMKVCLLFPVVQAAYLPINNLFAMGRPWLFGRGIIVGVVVFPVATWFLLPQIGGLLAVTAGSLLGRTARTLAAYVDLYVLMRKEREAL